MHCTLELSQIQFAIKKILIDQLSQIVVLLAIYVVIFRRTLKLCSCTCCKTRTEVGAETGLASSTYHSLSTRRNQNVQQHSALRLDMAWHGLTMCFPTFPVTKWSEWLTFVQIVHPQTSAGMTEEAAPGEEGEPYWIIWIRLVDAMKMW